MAGSGEDVHANLRDAGSDHVDRFGGGVRKIDDAAGDEGTPVDNADVHRFSRCARFVTRTRFRREACDERRSASPCRRSRRSRRRVRDTDGRTSSPGRFRRSESERRRSVAARGACDASSRNSDSARHASGNASSGQSWRERPFGPIVARTRARGQEQNRAVLVFRALGTIRQMKWFWGLQPPFGTGGADGADVHFFLDFRLKEPYI